MTSLLRLPGREHDTPPVVPLTAREVFGNLIFSGRWVTAWFKATPVQWPFRPDADRKQWMLDAAAQYANLVGYRVTERVTSRPYEIADWAQNLDGRTPNPTVLPGGDSWPEYLRRRQLAMRGMEMAQKEVYIGVRFARRGPAEVLRELFQKGSAGERDNVAREADLIAGLLRGGALNARPLTGPETEWLLHRSLSLGLPVPYDRDSTGTQHWLDDDLACVTDGVFYEDTRFGRTIKVTSRRADRLITRHVAVAALGQMTGVEVPEVGRSEWLHALDGLPFPHERVSTFDVVGPDITRKHVRRTLLAIRDQQHHYRQHELDAPDDLIANAAHARRIDSQLTTGQPAERVRLVGYHRVAVWGGDEEEAMARFRALKDRFRNRIAVHLPPNQRALLREFVPGEPLKSTTYQRRYNAMFHAAGAGLADGGLGDGFGDWIGTLDGSVRTPVPFDPWLPPEVLDSSGMYQIAGTPGAGKSALMGRIIDSALRRGVRTVLFDPSVTFAGMAQMDRWAPHSRVIDLHDAPAGILNPFTIVPLPEPGDYAASDNPALAYEQAEKRARAERFQLVLDVTQKLVPPSYRKLDGADIVLRNAVRSCESRDASLWDVVVHMEEHGGDVGKIIGRIIRDVNDMTVEGSLFFPRPDSERLPLDALFTVITIGGLTLPPKDSDEEQWSPAERVAVPLIGLATGLASRLVYVGDRRRRKLLILDESYVLSDWGSGRALFRRLARDSRKWNVAVFAAGQQPKDALDMSAENLIAGAFVGRIEDEAPAADALRLLGVEQGIGYEDVVRSLSPKSAVNAYREFLFRDPYGRVGKMQVTFDDDPDLLAALNTRPGETR